MKTNQISSRPVLTGRPDDFESGVPLPSPVSGGHSALSSEGKKKIKELSGPRPGVFLATLSVTWASIFGAMWLAAWANNTAVYIAVILFIGTRQNILALLIHEQTHYLCSRKPWGDVVTNLFAAWPIVVVTIEGYSKTHLSHHAHYFTENDPDFVRKRGKEWTFPMKVRFLFWLFFKDSIGGTFLELLSGKRKAKEGLVKREAVLPVECRIFFYAAIIGASIFFGFWKEILLMWLIPLFVVLPFIVRFSAICEHKYDVASGKIEESTATIILRWWERLLFPRLHFNYHIYHHFYPSISFCNLPKVHALYQKEGLVDERNLFRGYPAYFRYLLDL